MCINVYTYKMYVYIKCIYDTCDVGKNVFKHLK